MKDILVKNREDFSEQSEELDEESDGEFSSEESEGSDDEGEKIIDEPLDSEHMPHMDGEFAPYFSNVTEALMFCWIQKHNICMYATVNASMLLHVTNILILLYFQQLKHMMNWLT
jgi:hypothetical protein